MIQHREHRKLVIINTCLYGSTGRIVRHLEKVAADAGFDVWTATAYERHSGVEYHENDIVIGNLLSRYIHILLSRFTGLGGVFSLFSTLAFIRKLKKISPDCIHLHNLHNAYINLPVLFRFIKKNHIKTVWTFHDCWPFTGRCPYFDITKCEKWRNGCKGDCPFPKNEYPISYVNNSERMLRIKTKYVRMVDDLMIVTPSKWLAGHVRNSYLSRYKTVVINNGIDLSVFRPCESNVREKYGIKSKYVVLGVALAWDRRKGIDVFLKLNELLSKDYQIVLVGVSSDLLQMIPDSVICLEKTDSQKELAELYSAADVFLNPTREDNFPTVNIESIACGTPVITFNTGGSPEMIDETCGIVVEDGDDDALKSAIHDVCQKGILKESDCVKRAQEYNMNDRFNDYVMLY